VNNQEVEMEKRINTILWGLVMAGILWIVRTQVGTGERVAVLANEVQWLSQDVVELKIELREMRNNLEKEK